MTHDPSTHSLLWYAMHHVLHRVALTAAKADQHLDKTVIANGVVTCEIKSFQNYFTGSLQLMNIFQHVHCRRNNFEIILELLQLLK